MDSTLLEPGVLTLYLHQNMPGFFAEIDEFADCLDCFSHEDGVRAKLEYSYAMQQEIYEFERHSSLTCALALTETNLHCKDAQRKDRFYAMQQPQWFECVRTSKTNKLLLQDAVKEK
jgi:hypothetical protein